MFLIICVADIRQIIRAHVQSIPNLATQYFLDLTVGSKNVKNSA